MDDYVAPSKSISRDNKVPIASTLLLINNFVANSIVFLNSFADTCEKRICTVSNNITKLEILLAVLEAKLNSIPGLEYSSNDLPSTETKAPVVAPSPSSELPAQPSTQAPLPQAPPVPMQQSAAPPPPPPPPVMNVPQEVKEAQETKEEAPSIDTSGLIAVKDHPDYAPFFKMAKVGVPSFVVQGKMEALGLDGSLLDDPEKMVPAP